MRISRRKFGYRKIEYQKQYRVNEYIRSPQVRLIDENGQNIGVIPTQKALDLAREKELDLVEVSPLAQPPVAKIINFNKLKYEEDKSRRKEKAKHKIVETKVIRLSLRIGEHDMRTRANQANYFLSENNKVKVELALRGRERQKKELAAGIIKKFIDSLNQIIPIQIEQEVKSQGDQLTALIAKKS